jgi:4-amino-4-deoxy-L-arabinose transferase-like glycosyltransferase
MTTARFHPALIILLALAIAAAMLLPLNLLTLQPFHHDEALYATWSLRIASGQDPWLTDTPIDKPPLYLYLLAGTMHLLGPTETAARLPSLAAAGLTVLLTFLLGRRLYGPATGLLAAWLLALSPFALMFAPTAFTDPLLVALVLGGGVAAAYGRAGWAGLLAGLALATKQQGLFFVPLIAALLLIPPDPARPYRSLAARFGLGLLAAFLPALLWDMARSQPSGFLTRSLTNYGGLRLDPAGFAERAAGFIDLLTYGTASPLLNLIFAAGLPLLLLFDARRVAADKTPPLGDGLLALFIAAFLLLHSLVSFQVWDRYLLGLLPLLALLLARILLLPGVIVTHFWPRLGELPGLRLAFGMGLAVLLAASLGGPVQDAVNGRYPLGSNSAALRGIGQIVGYLQGQVGADTTLHHHWLGAHWRFYLWGYPYDLRYWDTPADLAAHAAPGHLLAFPASRSRTEAEIALKRAGLRLREIARAYAPDGAPTIILYRLEAMPKMMSDE